MSKMAMGCVLGVSFLPLMYTAKGLGADQVKVAPARLVSMLMGMWFMSNFFGNYLSGHIGSFYEKMSRESFFLMLAALGVAAGIAIFALSRPLKDAVGHDS